MSHKPLFLLLFLAALAACRENGNADFQAKAENNTATATEHTVRFKSIRQVYNDTASTKWTDAGSFWWLYFEPGKVWFDFNPSCGYWFPARPEDNRIVFYWALNSSCTFNRGLDTAFAGIQQPVKEKPFGQVTLVNDTTLRVDYFYEDWVRKVNECQRESIDTLFPSVFRIMRL
jgi:hypothetical protein